MLVVRFAGVMVFERNYNSPSRRTSGFVNRYSGRVTACRLTALPLSQWAIKRQLRAFWRCAAGRCCRERRGIGSKLPVGHNALRHFIELTGAHSR